MATVTSKNSTVMGSNGAAPSNEGMWREYAVSPDLEPTSHANGQNMWHRQQGESPGYPKNGATGPEQPRSSSTEPTRFTRTSQPSDSTRLAPSKPKTTARKISDTSGPNGGDADSLLDLYSRSTDNLRTVPWTEPTPGVKRKGSTSASISDKTLADKWIHRDKLAQIENREMREFGLKVAGRSSSRLANQTPTAASGVVESRETETRDGMTSESSVVRGNLSESDKRRRLMSPQQATEDESAYADLDGYQDPDAQRAQIRRPNTSRIPVSRVTTSSPTSQEYDVQGNSGSQWPHSRDISGTNQPFPAGSNGQESMDSSSSSPSKGKPMAKKPASASRNASASKNSPAQRSTSDSRSPGSPGRQSNSGDGNPRPPTARPEGEPPWIATMFKPDPRLPADQQMLPTHAKRLAQEQGYAFDELDPERSEYRLVDDPSSNEEFQPPEQATQPAIVQKPAVEQVNQPRDLRQEQSRNHQANPPTASQYSYPQTQSSQPQYVQTQPQVFQQPVINPQTFQVPPETGPMAEHEFDYHDPEKSYGYPWPLKTPSPQAPETPPKTDANWARNGGVTMRTNSDATPRIQKTEATPKRASPRTSRQPTSEKQDSRMQRLPEPTDDEIERKKGCGCCIVM